MGSFDFAVTYMRVIDPVPYRVINTSTAYGPHSSVAGVNFAFGGTGVFPTYSPDYPTITTQIDQFEALLNNRIVAPGILESSIALLVLSGNDYFAYNLQYPSNEVYSIQP